MTRSPRNFSGFFLKLFIFLASNFCKYCNSRILRTREKNALKYRHEVIFNKKQWYRRKAQKDLQFYFKVLTFLLFKEELNRVENKVSANSKYYRLIYISEIYFKMGFDKRRGNFPN